MEEAAFISAIVFKKVVAPLMLVDQCALLAISTPENDDNFYSILLSKKKADGITPLFKTCVVGLSCDACRAAGTAATCKHRRDLIPSWQSEATHDLIKSILDDATYQAEGQGLINNDKTYAFERGHLLRTFAHPTVR